MAGLAVWRFDSAGGAAEVAHLVAGPEPVGAGVVRGAALVAWEAGDRRPRVRRLATPPSGAPASGVLDDTFWHLLVGTIFLVPLLGAELGTAAGAGAGSLADIGIDDRFVNRVRDQVVPGRTALFVLADAAVLDRLREALAGGPAARPIRTDLSADQEAALGQVFGG